MYIHQDEKCNINYVYFHEKYNFFVYLHVWRGAKGLFSGQVARSEVWNSRSSVRSESWFEVWYDFIRTCYLSLLHCMQEYWIVIQMHSLLVIHLLKVPVMKSPLQSIGKRVKQIREKRGKIQNTVKITQKPVILICLSLEGFSWSFHLNFSLLSALILRNMNIKLHGDSHRRSFKRS